MADKCSTCKFWAGDNIKRRDATWSRCRVNSPEVSSRCIDGRLDMWVGQWPWTTSDDWCGSWNSRGQATGVVVETPTIES